MNDFGGVGDRAMDASLSGCDSYSPHFLTSAEMGAGEAGRPARGFAQR